MNAKKSPGESTVGRRERNNRERRKKLLAVARRLFDARGFEATTVAQIAAGAGLAVRTVYNFFPTKVDLLAALLAAEIREGLASKRLGDRRLPADPRRGLLELVRAQISTMASFSKSEQKLVNARAILADGASEAGRYTTELDVFSRDEIRDRLEVYLAKGSLRRGLDTEAAAVTIHAMLNGLYLEWLQSETAFEATQPVVERSLDLVLQGLSPRRVGRS